MGCYNFKPFTPEFLKWTLPFFTLDKSIDENRDLSLKSKENGKHCRSQLAAHYEPSHLDLHWLLRYTGFACRVERFNGA